MKCQSSWFGFQVGR